MMSIYKSDRIRLTIVSVASFVFFLVSFSLIESVSEEIKYNVQESIKMNTSQFHTDGIVEVGPSVHAAITGLNKDYLPVAFLEKGYLMQKPIARIVLPDGKFGTGFLISPSLLITNNHVINDKSLALDSKFEFNYQKDINNNTQAIDTYYATPDFFYTNDETELDFTIIKLSNYPGKKWGYISLNSRSIYKDFQPESHVGKVDASPLQIIQHPESRYKEVVLHECVFTKIIKEESKSDYTNFTLSYLSSLNNPKYFRYTCDTNLGSSGSPVFDRFWNIMALHHGNGDKKYDRENHRWIFSDNEGVSISSIVYNIKENLKNKYEDILKELGI